MGKDNNNKLHAVVVFFKLLRTCVTPNYLFFGRQVFLRVRKVDHSLLGTKIHKVVARYFVQLYLSICSVDDVWD